LIFEKAQVELMSIYEVLLKFANMNRIIENRSDVNKSMILILTYGLMNFVAVHSAKSVPRRICSPHAPPQWWDCSRNSPKFSNSSSYQPLIAGSRGYHAGYGATSRVRFAVHKETGQVVAIKWLKGSGLPFKNEVLAEMVRSHCNIELN